MRDIRNAPFIWQSVEAMAAIRGRFEGRERKTAIAVYVSMTEVANEARSASFRAYRQEIASRAGISVATLDRIVTGLCEIQLLQRETQPKGVLNGPNGWTLIDPPADQPKATPDGVTGYVPHEEPHARHEEPHQGGYVPHEEPRLLMPDTLIQQQGGLLASKKSLGEERQQDAGAGASGPSDAEVVWNHYCSMPGKRKRPLPTQERKIINETLKVATVDELLRAIDMCFRSDYHMKTGRYKDRPGQKYDKLTQIIRGRQGKETTRERIDFWLERETAVVAGSGVTSVDPALIARRKQDVQRGHRLKGDALAVRKAQEAEAWLAELGIKVVRKEDGFPTFE